MFPSLVKLLNIPPYMGVDEHFPLYLEVAKSSIPNNHSKQFEQRFA